MDRSELAIVIPALNEENTISSIVHGVNEYGSVIVIDDGSTDLTNQYASEAGAHVVSHKLNKGYDEALNSGFKYAAANNFKYVITFDADGQHRAELIKKFADSLLEKNDLVMGMRDKKARISEKLFGFLTSKFYNVSDPLCGIKAYTIDLYNELGHFDSYGSIGTELLLYALKKGKKISEIAVNVQEREDNPRFANLFSANMKILRAMIIGLLKRF